MHSTGRRTCIFILYAQPAPGSLAARCCSAVQPPKEKAQEFLKMLHVTFWMQFRIIAPRRYYHDPIYCPPSNLVQVLLTPSHRGGWLRPSVLLICCAC